MIFRDAISAVAVLCILGLPTPTWSRTSPCERKLSVLESDVQTMAHEIQGTMRQIEEIMEEVGSIEDDAMHAAECPESTLSQTADQRRAVSALPVASILDRARVNLACTHGFVARISDDIAKAQQADDTDMVIRLNGISKRILGLDTQATDLAVDAEFLASRRSRLLKAVTAIDDTCTEMDEIYG